MILIGFIIWAMKACGPLDTTSAQAPVQEQVEYDQEGCNIKTSSRLANEHKVSAIRNLEKQEFNFGTKNECTVDYDITVDGTEYHLTETETGLEQMASVCYYATDRARKNLLLSLGGNFKTEANINCRRHDQ
jgi:hypothetical protein